MSWVVLLLLSLVKMDIVWQLHGVELFFLQRVRAITMAHVALVQRMACVLRRWVSRCGRTRPER